MIEALIFVILVDQMVFVLRIVINFPKDADCGSLTNCYRNAKAVIVLQLYKSNRMKFIK